MCTVTEMGLFLHFLPLFMCGLSLSLMGGQAMGSYCNAGQAKPGDPPLPVINVTAFTIEYQVNILDRQYTMWAKEAYDNQANKVRMTTVKDGKEQGIILDYNDNIIIRYSYGEPSKATYLCSISQLNTSSNSDFDLFGGGLKDQSIPHVYSSADIFRFGRKLGESYMGRATIDGLETDHWRSCMYWADVKDNFTLDYYFTTNDWTPVDSNTPKQVPVRAVVQGIKTTNGYKLNHLYEYLNFRTYQRLPEENFALPQNMKCEDTKSLRIKTLSPAFPGRFSYTMETFVNNSETREVIYDQTKQLVWTSAAGENTIDDFNTGVHYSLNKAKHSCTTRPLSQRKDFAVKINKGIAIMKKPEELFYLNGTFTYTGQVDKRGIKCDAWFRTADVNGINTRVEVFFATQQEKYTEGVSPESLVALTLSNDKQVTTLNTFNFLVNPDISNNPFDISVCKNSSTMIHIRMILSFEPPAVFFQGKYQSVIHDKLSQALVNLTGMKPLQVQWSDLVWDGNDEIHWFGSLLAPEPSSTRAAVKAQKADVDLDNTWSKIQDYVDRGHFKIDISLPSNMSTHTISATLKAAEIKKVTSVADVHDDKDYSLRDFILKMSSVIQPFEPNEILTATNPLDCADLCLRRGRYHCNLFTFCHVSKQCLLGSNSSSKNFIVNQDCDTYYTDEAEEFYKVPGLISGPIPNGQRANADTAAGCASVCLQQKGMDCESFYFCDALKQCLLSSNHSYGNSPPNRSTATSCKHYSKRYIYQYAKSDGVTLSDQLAKTAALTVKKTTVERCADVCSRDLKGCLGFSYCKETGQCQLVTFSSRQSLGTREHANCSVYTLNKDIPFIGALATQGSDDEDTSYSSGVMAGLAIAMLFVGAAICAGVIYMLHRFGVKRIY